MKKELKELIIAMKMMFEAKTVNLDIETKIDKIRLKDFIKHAEREGLNMSEENHPSWPDDFEEDWE